MFPLPPRLSSETDKPQALVLHRSTAAFSGAEQLPPMPATMARTSSPRDKVTSAGNSLRRSEFTDDGVAATSPRSLSGRERPAPALLRVMHAAGTGSGKSRLCLSAEASVDSTDFHKQVGRKQSAALGGSASLKGRTCCSSQL